MTAEAELPTRDADHTKGLDAARVQPLGGRQTGKPLSLRPAH